MLKGKTKKKNPIKKTESTGVNPPNPRSKSWNRDELI